MKDLKTLTKELYTYCCENDVTLVLAAIKKDSDEIRFVSTGFLGKQIQLSEVISEKLAEIAFGEK